MKKGIYISATYNSKTGGGIVSNVVKQSLQSISGIKLLIVDFPMFGKQAIKLYYMLKGRLLGVTPKIENDIIQYIKEFKPEFVFINSSNLGVTARKIKRECPHIRLITLLHNVEFIYAQDAWKTSHKLYKLLTLIATKYNERLIVKYSSVIIALNTRDSEKLLELYDRPADKILPICLRDRFDESLLKEREKDQQKIALFVGSNFYANYYGIRWFIKNVAPYIDGVKVLIVGNGFERNKQELELYNNVEVVGTVDHVDSYYYTSDFVISPIFDGSGMKTKTAEALMFGKTIFGTTEAFQGYNLEYDKVGQICNNAVEFISAINNYNINTSRFNKYSRKCYEKNFSIDRLNQELENIMLDATL